LFYKKVLRLVPIGANDKTLRKNGLLSELKWYSPLLLSIQILGVREIDFEKANFKRFNLYCKMKNKFGAVFILLMGSVIISQAQATLKPTVLFVCEHGAARSVIAFAYFNKLVKERGLDYQAVFRGTSPDTVLTAATIAGLTKDGFAIKNWKPLKVTQADVARASQIVTFDCVLPNDIQLDKPPSKWDGIPAISKDYDNARNKILDPVKILIEELASKKK
jgi:arsenate reductase (thioredoxin)